MVNMMVNNMVVKDALTNGLLLPRPAVGLPQCT